MREVLLESPAGLDIFAAEGTLPALLNRIQEPVVEKEEL
jgi:hypothetical protein